MIMKGMYEMERSIGKKEYSARLSETRRRYRAERHMARDKYQRERRNLRQSFGKPLPKDPPKRGKLEEIGNSVTHGVGAAFAVVALILMLIFANGAYETVGAIIYFFGMFASFGASCLYHSFKHGRAAKRLFRRFDYTGIYLLIGATFAPSLLAVVGGTFGIAFFITQWAVIAVGISLVCVFGPSRLRFIHIPLFVVLGWSAIMLLPSLIAESFALAMWILAGGIIYTLGIIPYMIKLKVSHFIWHFFVLAGAVVQWIGIFSYIYLA